MILDAKHITTETFNETRSYLFKSSHIVFKGPKSTCIGRIVLGGMRVRFDGTSCCYGEDGEVVGP